MPQLPSLLSDLSDRLGVEPLTLEDGTQFTLLFDGTRRITVDHDREDNAVFFSGVVGDDGMCQGVDSYRRLLSSSVLGADTGGAAFGLDADTGEIVLWKRYSDVFADAAELAKELESFLATLIHLNGALPRTLPGKGDETAPRPRGDAAMESAAWSGLRA